MKIIFIQTLGWPMVQVARDDIGVIYETTRSLRKQICEVKYGKKYIN